MKNCTDINQSKELTKFLSLESADMYYINGDTEKLRLGKWVDTQHDDDDVPCWSFSALLNILSIPIMMNKDSFGKYHFYSPYLNHCITSDSLIDAIYKTIIRLHELNLL